MKIGVFGGAFNPVHNGHLRLMEYQCSFLQLDKLLVIPTANPPHKSSEGLVPGSGRTEMLRLAINSNNFFEKNISDRIEISDIELRSNGKSYTYLTLKQLKEKYPDDDFFLLVGSDQLINFKNWYRYKDILSMAKLCAMVREENEKEKCSAFLEENQEEFSGKAELIICKPFVVSSSQIRERLSNKESISGLVPEQVEQYIKEKGLYINV